MINVDLKKFYVNPCESCRYKGVCPPMCMSSEDSIIPSFYVSDDIASEKYINLLDNYVNLIRNLGFNPVLED